MAAQDGWPSARFGGCTEPGLQAGSPAAYPLTCAAAVLRAVPGRTWRAHGLRANGAPLRWLMIGPRPLARPAARLPAPLLVAANLPGIVAVRDSKDPRGPALLFSPTQ